MVKSKFQDYFPFKPNAWTYSCLHCRAHLARHEDLISKSFQGSQGRAYLFSQVINVDYSEAKQRVLLTGIHFVADVFCACCSVMLGWRYERAMEPSQRYKEGKVIVELAHLIKDNCWDMEWLNPKRFFPTTVPSPTTLYQSSALPKSKEVAHSHSDSTAVPSMFRSPWPLISNSSSPPSPDSVSPEPSTYPTGLNLDNQSRLLSTVYFSSLAYSSSPTTSVSVPCPLDRHTLSPGPSSCGSSCYGRSPEQELWCANQLLTSDCDLSMGTAAHGARANSPTRSDVTPSTAGTTAATNFDVTSCLKSRTSTMDDAVIDKHRRPKNRPQPLNLRLSVTGSTNPIGHKHRVRLRNAFTTRRASSSSPSRAFLLPLTSDDESDQSADGPDNANIAGPSRDVRPSGDSVYSTPHTLPRSGRKSSPIIHGT